MLRRRKVKKKKTKRQNNWFVRNLNKTTTTTPTMRCGERIYAYCWLLWEVVLWWRRRRRRLHQTGGTYLAIPEYESAIGSESMVNADIIITIIKAVVTRFVVLLLFISLFNLVAPWRRDALIYIYIRLHDPTKHTQWTVWGAFMGDPTAKRTTRNIIRAMLAIEITDAIILCAKQNGMTTANILGCGRILCETMQHNTLTV